MWSWHLAHPTLRPINAVETVSTATIGSSPESLLSRTTPPRAKKPNPNKSSGLGSMRERRPMPESCVAVIPVSGQLRAYELVIRHILVQSMDHPVAPEMDAR